MRRIVILVLALALAGAGCSKRDDDKKMRDDYVCEPVTIASAYVGLVENPAASRALLVGAGAKALEGYLTRAGVRCQTALDGSFDLIFADCAKMSKASFEALRGMLAPKGVVVWMLDVRDVTLGDLRKRMGIFELYDVHLWMPGRDRWLVTGCKSARKVSLAEMVEIFARDSAFEDIAKAKCGTLPEMFANYAGGARDFAPAFAANEAKRLARPECFLTKEIPQVDWIDTDLDDDIFRNVASESRSMQIVRRLAVEGAMLADAGGADRVAATNGIERLARAAARNPNDLVVVERLDRLDRNARGFLGLGKILLAMKCYETMVLIQPNNAAAVHNFGMCLKKLGKTELAEKILKRAEALSGSPSEATPKPEAKPALPSGSRYRNAR